MNNINNNNDINNTVESIFNGIIIFIKNNFLTNNDFNKNILNNICLELNIDYHITKLLIRKYDNYIKNMQSDRINKTLPNLPVNI